jgi:hypothetical protein
VTVYMSSSSIDERVSSLTSLSESALLDLGTWSTSRDDSVIVSPGRFE